VKGTDGTGAPAGDDPAICFDKLCNNANIVSLKLPYELQHAEHIEITASEAGSAHGHPS
jgi:hypothetical protein